MLGTVKFFNEEKHYGFIKPKDGGKDIFVHGGNINAPVKKLFQDEEVEYAVKDGKKGPEAIDVIPTKSKGQ
jgi:cold shock protein